MGSKGTALLEIFVVAFIASVLGFGVVEGVKRCHFHCIVNKLDLHYAPTLGIADERPDSILVVKDFR